ncbi:MAG: ectoine synthase [Thermodesulfobacteriota bacterium]|nr:ectoine synthase [Thermodesulfobacteriota bacterium]
MIVRTLNEVKGTSREVYAENNNWVSRRLLLKDDRMGFSMHDTVIFAGTQTHIWYKNHLEAVYCVEGKGEIETLSDGKLYPILPGTIYALDKNDEHYLRAHEDLHLVCTFSPALRGDEVHRADGSYAPSDD